MELLSMSAVDCTDVRVPLHSALCMLLVLGSVGVMTSSNSVTIEYSGSAVFVGAFAQALTDEGLQVRYDRPPGSVEERGVPDPGTVVQVYVLIEAWVSEHPVATAAATAAAVHARQKAGSAIERWRRGRLARAADVRIQDGPRHRHRAD
jgi:hypothetical protein